MMLKPLCLLLLFEVWGPQYTDARLGQQSRRSRFRTTPRPSQYHPKFTSRRTFHDRATAEEVLLLDMLRDYDTDARGVTNQGDTVRVEIQYTLLRIQGLDERSQVLTTTGLVITDWEDSRLVWDPEEYLNITDIVVRPERIWLPELALMNGAEELSPDFKKIRAMLRSNGSVHWEPGGIFATTCDIDIQYFPFDEQACVIQLGAWAYYTSRMNLTNGANIIQTHDFKKNGEWDIASTHAAWNEVILPCCPYARYPFVEFTLRLKRRCTFYVMNIILPCVLLSILVMIGFCLPPDAGEKISLGISVLLAFTVFLLMVAESVPRTSLHIPVIVIYLTSTMALGTASVCLTVVVLNVHHRDPEFQVPGWVRKLFLVWLARLCCVRARKPLTRAATIRRRKVIKNGRARGDDAGFLGGPLGLQSGLRQVTSGSASLLTPMLSTANSTGNDVKFPPQRDGLYMCSSCVHGCGRDHCPSKPDNNSAAAHNDHVNDWKELAHVLDRIFFIIVLVTMTASTMIIATVPMYKPPYSKDNGG